MGLGLLNISRKLFVFTLLVGVFLMYGLLVSAPVRAAAGINSQINFQGRLLNAQGAVVPDGYYNIEFKIYQDGDGQTAGDTTGSPAGTLKWTEDYLNTGTNQGVEVKNGYLSVQLGSINPFGTSVNWNSDTLWLSMQIGNTSTCTVTTSFQANCGGDGEMTPMKRLSSTPYSLNSGLLGGLSSAQFLQLAQGLQTDSSTNTSIAVNKTGASGDILNLQANGSQAFVVSNSGNVGIGIGITTPTTALQVAGNVLIQPLADSTTAFRIQNATNSKSVLAVDTSGGQVVLGASGASGVSGQLQFNYAGSIGDVVLKAADPGTNPYTLTLPAETGTICTTAGSASCLSVYAGSGSYVSLAPASAQADASTNSSIFINKTGASGNILELQKSATDQFVITNVGNITAAGTYNTNTFNSNTLSFGGSSTASIDAAANQTLNLGTTASSHSTTVGSTAGTSTTTVQSGTGNVALNTGTAAFTETTGTRSLTVQARSTNLAGSNLAIQAGAGGTGAIAVSGGALTLQGGNAAGTGNANGGNVQISGGTGVGTGASGLVILTTPTFSTTTNDPNCYTGGALVSATCTIATSSTNGSGAIVVGFSQQGQTATLPSPTITTAGRVVYIIAANGSSDFTLSVNGGGTGNQIAMRQNTSATMIWSGTGWTAAGASSSTTLQSAYDNTLQSAGGAELVVSHTSATNGLTIRDSSTNPVNGTLLSVQTASAAGLISVNGNVKEYSSDSGAETAGGTSSTFPANTWAAVGATTVSRYTTVGNFIATGQASVSVTTPGSANVGAKDTLTSSLVANTHYNVSFAARLSSGTFTDMNVYYSVDGTTASVPCTASQAVTTSIWTKVNCSFTAPASGITTGNAILIRQTNGTARTFYLDNLSVTISADYNYATDGGVDDNTNFGTNWTSVSGATITRSTAVGNDTSDSAQVATTGTGQGVRNKLSINPLASTLYRVTVYAASTTAGFNSFTVRYSRDGGTNFVSCADYNTQSISSATTSFTEVTCYITTDAVAATNPYVYFTQSDATGRTFYVDTFSMTLNTNATPNVQIGGGVNGGPVTLLTLDRAASAPIASNNDAFLGSMYYDTTLGKLQCYEADGWGACGSSPDNIVTLSPEFTNAVMHGTGVGTMNSDICSDTLNINNGTSGQPTICGPNETYNFYKWTSPQASAQTYSIYVTYQLPGTFKTFASGQTSVMGRTDSTNATVQYSVYRNNTTTGLTQCGPAVPVSNGAVSAWQIGIASGAADPSTCGFAAGDSIVFKIDVIASSNAGAYVGNLNFTFSNK